MTIGKRIQARRKEIGMTVDQLAEKIGKNRATVYRYENNDIEKYPLDILQPLADALQTTPAFLMGWEDPLTSEQQIDVYINGAKKWADDFRFSEDQKVRLHEFMADYALKLKQTVNAMADAVQKDGSITATAEVNRSISAMKEWSSCALNYVNNEFSEEENSPSESELTEGEKDLLELFRLIPVDRQPEALELLRVTLKMLQKP